MDEETPDETVAIVGIDLGTVNTCFAVFEDNDARIVESRDGTVIPSYVFYDGVTGAPIVGNMGRNPKKNRKNVLYDAKRFIGRDYCDEEVQKHKSAVYFNVVEENKKPHFEIKHRKTVILKSPEEVSSDILKYLQLVVSSEKETDIVKAVITMPAYFNNKQKEATKKAAELAEIEVLRLISEPTAAGLYFVYKERNNFEEGTVLVFDLGGGTFDLAVLKLNKYRIDIQCIWGDGFLGGRDIDKNVADFIAPKCELTLEQKQRLTTAAEKIKIALSKDQHHTVTLQNFFEEEDLIIELSRKQFNDINESLFKNCMIILEECLYSNKIDKSTIDKVLLVGGSTRIPAIKNNLKTFFNGTKTEIIDRYNPEEIVAKGAAVFAHLLTSKKHQVNKDVNTEFRREKSVRKGLPNSIIRASQEKNDSWKYAIVPIDVFRKFQISEKTPFNLGYEEHYSYFKLVVPQNSEIPFKITVTCRTVLDNQKLLPLRIYEGIWTNVEANDFLGEIAVNNLPQQAAGTFDVKVTFEVDVNNMLSITASAPGTTFEKLEVNLQDNTADHKKIKHWNIQKDDMFKKIRSLKIATYFLCKKCIRKHQNFEKPFAYLLEILDSKFEDTNELLVQLNQFKRENRRLNSKTFWKEFENIMTHCDSDLEALNNLSNRMVNEQIFVL